MLTPYQLKPKKIRTEDRTLIHRRSGLPVIKVLSMIFELVLQNLTNQNKVFFKCEYKLVLKTFMILIKACVDFHTIIT